MNQYIQFHFAIAKNERLYQLIISPGSPWEEVAEVLIEFQEALKKLKVENDERLKAEAEKATQKSEDKKE